MAMQPLGLRPQPLTPSDERAEPWPADGGKVRPPLPPLVRLHTPSPFDLLHAQGRQVDDLGVDTPNIPGRVDEQLHRSSPFRRSFPQDPPPRAIDEHAVERR